jgi:hypothetical protein
MLDLSVSYELLERMVFSVGLLIVSSPSVVTDLDTVECLPRMKCVAVVWLDSYLRRLVGVKKPRFGPPSLAIILEIATSIFDRKLITKIN